MQKVEAFGQVLFGNVKANTFTEKNSVVAIPLWAFWSSWLCWDSFTHTSLRKRRSLWIREAFPSPAGNSVKESVTSADHCQINRLSSAIHNKTFLAKIEALF